MAENSLAWGGGESGVSENERRPLADGRHGERRWAWRGMVRYGGMGSLEESNDDRRRRRGGGVAQMGDSSVVHRAQRRRGIWHGLAWFRAMGMGEIEKLALKSIGAAILMTAYRRLVSWGSHARNRIFYAHAFAARRAALRRNKAEWSSATSSISGGAGRVIRHLVSSIIFTLRSALNVV